MTIHNFPDWEIVKKNEWSLSIQEKREKEFLSFIYKDQLIAYGRIFSNDSKVFLGIGLKPDVCGYGYGKYIVKLLIQESEKRFPNSKIALEVRQFNKRARKCYEKLNFKIKHIYEKETLMGNDTFIYMEYQK